MCNARTYAQLLQLAEASSDNLRIGAGGLLSRGASVQGAIMHLGEENRGVGWGQGGLHREGSCTEVGLELRLSGALCS